MNKLRYGAFILILIAAFSVTVYARNIKVGTVETQIYFVDADMLRLLPVKTQIPSGSAGRMAQRVCREIVEGRDDNPKIKRVIPKVRGALTVKVKDECAYVDIKSELRDLHPDGRDLELLTIYQIVNSLTGLDGIKVVRFTVDGERTRDFMGHIDLRETFVPDYYI